ncbi:hypothetical protein PHMEG_00030193 [Phytophthora megakarya]|uniref:Uncharacterized protein n=1 Tax=Phytophthora megakarya TaxID=4795 RepID=A0A225V0S5_9STRA|nr:hypothetical protein PHMEG_00030193 [Phytophthora megakarya]
MGGGLHTNQGRKSVGLLRFTAPSQDNPGIQGGLYHGVVGGAGLYVLLGMDFMFRAGVRARVREGLVQLPDEESILMYDEDVKVPQGVDLPVSSPDNLYLMPGEQAVVCI